VDLTPKYVEDHLNNVATPESFARALGEQALRAAAAAVSVKPAPSVAIPATITVTPAEAAGCIRVCANINGVIVCYHINL